MEQQIDQQDEAITRSLTKKAAQQETMVFDEDSFLHFGLKWIGFSDRTINSTGKETNVSRFRDCYYAYPSPVAKICNDLVEAFEDINPKYLLLTFYYLKTYPSVHRMAAYLDKTEKMLNTLTERKIKWIFDNVDDDEHPEMFIISVDGIHCQVWEPRIEPSSGWYSKKYNKAGLCYELGLAIYSNQLVWIVGPYPAGHNDIMIFKKPNGLMSKIPPGKKVVADEGYIGAKDVVATRNQFDTDVVK